MTVWDRGCCWASMAAVGYGTTLLGRRGTQTLLYDTCLRVCTKPHQTQVQLNLRAWWLLSALPWCMAAAALEEGNASETGRVAMHQRLAGWKLLERLWLLWGCCCQSSSHSPSVFAHARLLPHRLCNLDACIVSCASRLENYASASVQAFVASP